MREGLALLLGQGLGCRLGVESQPRRESGQVALDLGRGVAHLLGRDLGSGDGLAGVPQAALQLGLLVRAGPQRLGGLLAPGGVLGELLGERIAAGGHGGLGALQRRGGSLGHAGQLGVAPDARAHALERAGALGPFGLDALGQSALRAQVGDQLGAAHGPGALVGGLAAPGDHPFGAADGFGGLGHLARGAPVGGVGLVAGGVGARDRLPGLLGGAAGVGLLGRRGLGRGDQLVAPAPLLEHPLGPASGRLGQLPGGAVEPAARARDRDAAEVLGQAAQRIHHPDPAQQALGKRGDRGRRSHVLQQPNGGALTSRPISGGGPRA